MTVRLVLQKTAARSAQTIDATSRQKGVSDESLGSKWWKIGRNKTYKASPRHIFSDRFLIETQFAHVGNNFVLDFDKDELALVQPLVDIQSGHKLFFSVVSYDYTVRSSVISQLGRTLKQARVAVEDVPRVSLAARRPAQQQ